MPAKKAPSAKETPKSSADPKAMPSAKARTARGEEFARAGAGRLIEEPGHDAASAHQHHQGEYRDLGQRQGQGEPDVAVGDMVGRAVAGSPEGWCEGGEQDQGEDHRQILDDEPPHRDAALVAVEEPTLLQGTQQHHGARHREGQAEDEARADAPAPEMRQQPTHGGSGHDLHDRARQGDGAHRHQVLDREMQADPEHQQDHADFGELARELAVADEAGCVRPNQNPGQEIADQGRKPQPLGQHPTGEGQDETEGDDGNQLCRVRHGAVVFSFGRFRENGEGNGCRGQAPNGAR